MPDWDFETEYPEFAAWKKRLEDREAVQKVYSMDAFQMPKAT